MSRCALCILSIFHPFRSPGGIIVDPDPGILVGSVYGSWKILITTPEFGVQSHLDCCRNRFFRRVGLESFQIRFQRVGPGSGQSQPWTRTMYLSTEIYLFLVFGLCLRVGFGSNFVGPDLDQYRIRLLACWVRIRSIPVPENAASPVGY